MFVEMLLIIVLVMIWLEYGWKKQRNVRIVLLGLIFGLVFDLSRYLGEYAIIISGVILMIIMIARKE